MGCASTALIVGGGIAGLSAAIALTRVGVNCEVIEKGNNKEGASIAISGRSAEALDELGLYELVYQAGHPFPHDSTVVSLRNKAGELLSAPPARPRWANAKEAVGVYRPTLIQIMTNVAESLGIPIRQGVTFSHITNETDQVHVVFTDGDERSYDIMVGADGIDSATRKEIFPNHPSPIYAGQFSIRWMAPGPPVEPESWYSSSVGRLGFYSLPEGFVYVPAVLNIAEQRRYSDEETRKLFAELLDSMTAPAIVELRGRLKQDADLIGRPFRWTLVPDLWYRRRTILIGDAAHATTAHLGQGGGMAIEDAVVLAQCVRDEPTVEEAFQAFMRRRFDRVATVVHTSVELSKLEQKGAPPTEGAALMGKAFQALSSPY